MEEKLTWLLECHYSSFHADMILRALHDDSCSFIEFMSGCIAIHIIEAKRNENEFTPKEFANVQK